MDSIGRAIAVINLLAEACKPLTLKEISEQLSINKVSVFRTLISLEKENLVVKDVSLGCYSPGTGILQLSVKLISNLDLRSISMPYLEELRTVTHETTQLSLRVGLEQMFIESLQSPQSIRLVTTLGVALPLWAGATGKAILAFLTDEEKEIIYDRLRKSGKTVYASGKIIDGDSLSIELDKIRENGYAITVAERTSNASAVAAPIFYGKRVIASISVAGPLPRFNLDLAGSYGPLVDKIAKQISKNTIKSF